MEFQIKTTKDQAFYDITSFVERAKKRTTKKKKIKRTITRTKRIIKT
jgi:hypothetical protein